MDNVIEFTYKDGSRASWVVPEDKIQVIEDVLIEAIGEPDSIKC